MAEYTQSEDTAARYEAYGWEVVTIDGHDIGIIRPVYVMVQCWATAVFARTFADVRLLPSVGVCDVTRETQRRGREDNSGQVPHGQERQAQAPHRQDHHRQGHRRGRRHQRRARRGRRGVC